MRKFKPLFLVALLGFSLSWMHARQASAVCPEPAIADYTAYPVFMANAVTPNIMLIIDNSGSMNEPAYMAQYDHNTKYYGYFEPYKKYSYSSGVFYRNTAGTWDGNFLNWASMRKVDVVRKVLMGGLATSRTGGGNQTNIGDSGSWYWYDRFYGDWDLPVNTQSKDTWGVTPHPNTWFYFSLYNGYLEYYYNPTGNWWDWYYEDSYTIKVRKGEDIGGTTLADESYNFLDGNLAGIMQRLWSKARFGLEVFNQGNDDWARQNGGLIPRVIGSNMTDMINNIQNQACTTWTPLAEAYYTCIKYFKQEDMEASMDQANNVIPNNTAAEDPYNNPDPVACAKSFVLLLTDGASTKDLHVPTYLMDYDGDGNDGLSTVESGTTSDGKLRATAGSDTVKTFFLDYTGTTTYPAGTTPFTSSMIGDNLVLYDKNDHQVYYGTITAMTFYGGDTSGTSQITVSGTTNTTEWNSGTSTAGVLEYNQSTYFFSWRVVTPPPTNEAGLNAGSDYLDDLALYARTNDLRADLAGQQNLILYNVYAFGNDATARNLLRDASKNGGFTDKNGNNKPDLASEWDLNNDGVPDTYYEASNGYLLESQLIAAINDILKRAAAGTAVSVLATSGEGEGNLVQAYFRPSVTSGVTEVQWVGYLQSLWVDAQGNLREDTDGDVTLDETKDKIVVYFLDTVEGDAKIKRYTVSSDDPYPDLDTASYEVVALDGIHALWEAGSLLAARNSDDRKIFTFLDKDKDGVIDEPGAFDGFDDTGEAVRFHISGVSNIMPYLGVKDNTTWGYLGATQGDRALNLIEYIRGKETGFSGVTGMNVRTRVIDGEVWKLGDIVHSTPVSISKPPDNFHIIYSDESYQNYYSTFKNRETVVYVGGNDGMLHAFTSWVYSSTSKSYTQPTGTFESIGDEIWAYIPQSLLPHLKWLPSKSYSHVYYVDLKPKIFDAKILPDDTHYTDSDTDDNWGTILLCGLNYGGKQICVDDTFTSESGVTVSETRTFYPSLTAIDITEPRSPKVLWERSYQNQGFTTGEPAIIKVKSKWFAVFGSGPTDYDGESNQKAKVYVVDLKTGNSYPKIGSFGSGVTNAWLFEGGENDAFMNSPVSLDKNLDYNVDAVYFGETYYSANWKGKGYRVSIYWDWADLNTFVDNPNDSSHPWTMNVFFDANKPITAPMSLSIDFQDNAWVYFGTGRYIGQDDKTDTATQYLFGVKDPFFNYLYQTAPTNYYHNYGLNLVLDIGDLMNGELYTITTDGYVFTSSGFEGVWDDFLTDARVYDGWYRTLTTSKERVVTKPTILGGITFAPSFVPNSDVCAFGGDSYLYGLYFETGTPYYVPVLPDGTVNQTLSGTLYTTVLGRISLGAGKASALGIHVGQEAGAKAFVQQSTGTVLEAQVNPAFNVKSGIINWREK
ncbi:MAG: PilC/PilY family type IV pilus protein [Thermodesulfobacteriota bacterium]